MLVYAGLCWLVLVWFWFSCWCSWSPASHVGAGMLVTNIQLPASHAVLVCWSPTSNNQHPMLMLVYWSPASNPTTVSESCSISILICHTCQVDGLSYCISTNVFSAFQRSNYFVFIKKKNFIKLFTLTCERNGSKKQSVAFIYLYI